MCLVLSAGVRPRLRADWRGTSSYGAILPAALIGSGIRSYAALQRSDWIMRPCCHRQQQALEGETIGDGGSDGPSSSPGLGLLRLVHVMDSPAILCGSHRHRRGSGLRYTSFATCPQDNVFPISLRPDLSPGACA